MSNRSTEIGRIIRSGDLVLARMLVRKAIIASRGNLRATSRLLGVSWWTTMRIVPLLGLENVVVVEREKWGWWQRRDASTRVDTTPNPRLKGDAR